MSESEDLQVLHDWISEKREQGPLAIVTHKNGDMDTIGSALVLSKLIGKNSKACGIHISKIAKKIIAETKNDFFLMNPSNIMWPRTLSGIIVDGDLNTGLAKSAKQFLFGGVLKEVN